MPETVVICVSALVGLAMVLAAATYAFDARLRAQSDLAKLSASMADELATTLSAHAKLTSLVFDTGSANTQAVSALSERIALFEAALKETVKQIVGATGYSEEKYKQLLARNVREPARAK